MWILETILMLYGAFKMIVEIGGYVTNKVPLFREISRSITLRWMREMYSTEPGIEHFLEDVKDLLNHENLKHRFLGDKKVFYVYPRYVSDQYSDDKFGYNPVKSLIRFANYQRPIESVLSEIERMADAFGYTLRCDRNKGEDGIITVRIETDGRE